MQKIGDVNRWHHMPVGTAWQLPGEHPRTVRLNVNAPGRARFYLIDAHGEERFLGTSEMRAGLEFYVTGKAAITTPDEDVFIWSAEFEPTHFEVPDREIFTKIANRAARNPDLEYLMHLQQVNMERRLAAIQQDLEARYDARVRTEAVTPTSSAGGAGSEQSASDADGKPPVASGGADSAADGGSAAGDGLSDGADSDAGPGVPDKSAV